ncbi:MAG: hypothetical protein Ct9H300mP8_02190 [Gammaproteobacteria bacterium]|nr:MAG: hypothetical protein Ct9H300mP8_02190 [Gammaproteobacteria bacterium]
MNLVQWNPLRDFDDFFDRYGVTGRTFWRGGEPGTIGCRLSMSVKPAKGIAWISRSPR